MGDRSRRRTAWWQPLGLALVVSLGMWIQADTPAEGQPRSSRRSAGASGSGEDAITHADTKKLEAKLDQILQNQERIFQRLDEVMEELRIVKVRATLK